MLAGKRLAPSVCPASRVDPPTLVNHRLRGILGTEDTEAPVRGRFGRQDSARASELPVSVSTRSPALPATGPCRGPWTEWAQPSPCRDYF